MNDLVQELRDAAWRLVQASNEVEALRAAYGLAMAELDSANVRLARFDGAGVTVREAAERKWARER